MWFPVDTWGDHAFVCKSASGRSGRHTAINDIISRALSSANTPSTLEPHGLVPGTILRPDGASLLPWSGGKYLAWDATVSTTLAASYVVASSTQIGFASTTAADRKSQKYLGLDPLYRFQPVSLENLGPVCPSTNLFFSVLGRKISSVSGDPKETLYLRQRLSICLQRYNAILLKQSFIDNFPPLDE